MTKIYEIMGSDITFGESILSELLKNDDVAVKIWAAAHSLGLKINVSKVEQILREISEDESVGILAFNAKMTLKKWTNDGFLKF
ncbi:MAG: hypothetical protein MI892_25020 [Desulfobacterales bacterium]|nr:hypothetical protein [Desulfobacterales bacterium]